MTEVIIGSRESKLAVLQSEMVKSYIEQKNREENAGSEVTVNILTMKTTGDIILDRTLDKVGGLIWSALEQDAERESILRQILDRFDVDRERAEKDLDEFLDQMEQAGFLAR